MNEPDATLPLLILIVTICFAVAGVNTYYRGWATRREALRQSRLTEGEALRRRLRGPVDNALRRTDWGRRLSDSLAGAGITYGPTDFVLMVVASAAAAYIAVNLIFPPWLAFIAAALAARSCWWWVERSRAKRRDAFVAQLPDVARVLSNASSAGLSLRSALDLATSEIAEPAGGEISRVADELAIGQDLDDALASLQRRMPSREVGVLIAMLVIQQRSGGDLVSSLREMAITLEDRKELRREVKTVMSGAKFTGYVVAFLGAGTLLMLNLMSPGILDDMAASGIGRIALLIGATTYTIGFLLIRKTTRIEA